MKCKNLLLFPILNLSLASLKVLLERVFFFLLLVELFVCLYTIIIYITKLSNKIKSRLLEANKACKRRLAQYPKPDKGNEMVCSIQRRKNHRQLLFTTTTTTTCCRFICSSSSCCCRYINSNCHRECAALLSGFYGQV